MSNPTMKKSVKFDDECMGLYLDVQLPSKDWRRIRPDPARQARDVNLTLRVGPQELSFDKIASALANSAEQSAPRASTNPPVMGANTTPISHDGLGAIP